MGFFQKIKEMNVKLKEKNKGRNLYLLGKQLPKDASLLMIQGYEDAQIKDQNKQIELKKLKEKTKELKIKQNYEKQKLKSERITQRGFN